MKRPCGMNSHPVTVKSTALANEVYERSWSYDSASNKRDMTDYLPYRSHDCEFAAWKN